MYFDLAGDQVQGMWKATKYGGAIFFARMKITSMEKMRLLGNNKRELQASLVLKV